MPNQIVLLYADNISIDIEVEICTSISDAQEKMSDYVEELTDGAVENKVVKSKDEIEIVITDEKCSVYFPTTENIHYWNIKELSL